MRRRAVDAGVVIGWVVDEAGRHQRLRRLLAPDLQIAECANVLRKEVCRGELRADGASMAARLLELAVIDLAPGRSGRGASGRSLTVSGPCPIAWTDRRHRLGPSLPRLRHEWGPRSVGYQEWFR